MRLAVVLIQSSFPLQPASSAGYCPRGACKGDYSQRLTAEGGGNLPCQPLGVLTPSTRKRELELENFILQGL